MSHTGYRPAEEVEAMGRIEVSVTSLPRGGRWALLIECSACGPLAVHTDGTDPRVLATAHLTQTHHLGGVPV